MGYPRTRREGYRSTAGTDRLGSDNCRLTLGVRLATTEAISAKRAATLADALTARVVPIDVSLVVEAWCTLRVALRHKIPANDSWIAATALALGVPVVTQDDD